MVLPRCQACHLEVKNETAAVLLEHPWLQHGLGGLLGWNMHGVQAAEAPDQENFAPPLERPYESDTGPAATSTEASNFRL